MVLEVENMNCKPAINSNYALKRDRTVGYYI